MSPEALEWEQGRAIAERAAQLGCPILELKTNQLTGLRGGTVQDECVRAMSKLRDWFSNTLAEKLPMARILYWT